MSKDDIISVPALSSVRQPQQVKGPLYLIRLGPESESKVSKIQTLLAIKLDRYAGHIDAVCHEVNVKDITSSSSADELYQLIVSEKLAEMNFPWRRVIDVKNLTYKKNK